MACKARITALLLGFSLRRECSLRTDREEEVKEIVWEGSFAR